MATREYLLELFEPLSSESAGIEKWVRADQNPIVLDRLAELDKKPLSRSQLNQLLLLAHEGGVSEGFFKYYWLETPPHTYDLTGIAGYRQLAPSEDIQDLDHLLWGLRRLYIDSLLYFGSIRSGYRFFRTLTFCELSSYFERRRYDAAAMKARGGHLGLKDIAPESRYLISEVACKNMDPSNDILRKALFESFDKWSESNNGTIAIKDLLDNRTKCPNCGHQEELQGESRHNLFTATSILNRDVSTKDDLNKVWEELRVQWDDARAKAITNTEYYLSMVNDLDVYVATSMRRSDDFDQMVKTCSYIFDEQLAELNLRYFDPTLSAARGHHDKGLIECLMVKCAKVLVYTAGKSDTYGKDSEAAMALSLGKPVIFYCDDKDRAHMLREIHPLSRLIQFESGVSVGAMIASSVDEVVNLLEGLFNNQLSYDLSKGDDGYFLLKEAGTGSVVRLQTSDVLLRETFWNYYHETNKKIEPGLYVYNGIVSS